MSEDNDYTPNTAYRGHNFDAARKAYDASAGRSYDQARAAGKVSTDLFPESLTTDSPTPLVILTDTSGSMSGWPGVIFSKFPYLEHECRTEYLGPDMEISFGAHDDRDCGNEFWLQARPFAKNEDLPVRIKELVHVGSGAGPMHLCESSDLLALYYARKVTMPKAVRKPILIFITDEKPYPEISVADAARAHVKLERPISTAEVMKELTTKYSVYVVQKPYESGESSAVNREVRAEWAKYVGDDRIALLPTADRVVDVLFGILAREADKIEYFQKELEDRQTPQQVDTVYKSLKTVHAIEAQVADAKKGKGKSVMLRLGKGSKTKKLTTDSDKE